MYTVGELKKALEDVSDDLAVKVTTDAAEGELLDLSDVVYESRGPRLLLVHIHPEPLEEIEDVVIKCPNCGEEV